MTLRRNLLLIPGALGALSLGAVAAAPGAVLNGLSALDSRRRAAGLRYGPQSRQLFDLYQPAGVAPAAGWPVLVFFYGGSWRSGERADYRFVGEALAGQGLLVMVADYRLYPEVTYPVFLQDAAAVVAHALDQASGWGGDPRRVFVMGHSAGAYNAAMVALDERWLAAQGKSPAALAGWIGLAGPYNFLPIRTLAVQPVFGHPNVAPDTQPVNHAAGSRLPALLLAAAQDELVNPRRNSETLVGLLRAAGAPVQWQAFDGVGHISLLAALAWPLRALAPVLTVVRDFVARPGGQTPSSGGDRP